MSEEKPLEALRNSFFQNGKVTWIGVRPERRAELTTPQKVEALADRGLSGDHRSSKNTESKRQVTLIQEEHIEAVRLMLHRDDLDPGLLRRNIVVSGINLQSLKEQQVRIGSALLEITGACHPCSRMEENLGKGGYNAMRGHGGWCAKVIEGGDISLGDEVGPA